METADGLPPTKKQRVDESTQDLTNLDTSTSLQSIASGKENANDVYRVTGIPIDYMRKQVKALLQTVLQLGKAGNLVKLRSIAISPNRKTKVATVCFSCRPISLPERADREWHFPIPIEHNIEDSCPDEDDDIIPQERIITVDSHFKGITALRSFGNLDEHKIDIIAISGLGGHAFGSFKARGGQYMWLCDSLPRDLPGAQIMIYGYDTQLHGSTSFQDIESLASSLRASIAAQRTPRLTNAKPRTVPLIFVAHSLGGLIVKESIIQTKKDKKHQDLLESIYGGLFFGVPSQGMEIASLVPMVAGQPNQALLHTLGKESQLLRNQSRDFPKAFDSKESEIFCYYETEMSRTAKLTEDNVWKMGGPLCILVDSSSARHTRPWENEAHNCIGMKRDHSTLVKFSPNDSDYDEVLAKLNRMALTAVSIIPRGTSGQLKLKQLTKKEKKAIEDSLKFNRMEARFFDVEAATTATCDWLLSIPEYDQWLDNDLVSEYHGFLWIKGKPGSGKSTIMKHVIEAATNSAIPSIIITFFFHARGTELERSILGMYRSVLLQIISKTPTILDDFSHLFSSKINRGEVYEWNIGELQAILITIMTRAQEYPVMWFIDALDECKDDEVLKLVKFVENIGHTAMSSGSSLRICLSTRHYPNIPIRWGIQLTLEKQDGHDQDIMTYIDSEFRAPHNLHVARIKTELRRRSAGVFIWVRLVVELLNAAFRRGEGKPAQLQQLLDSFPEELDDLFTNILKADPNSKDRSILCFQWVLFSKRPLNPEELYSAVIAGTKPGAIGKWNTDDIDSEGTENFILYISKGLVEVSKTYGTIQFIHESVRDFLLLHNGLAKLEPNLATNARGFSEERLKHCCYQYMVLGLFKDNYCSPAQLSPTPSLDGERKILNRDDGIWHQFPFAMYAVRYVFAHAELAQSCGIDQRDFLANFDRPDSTRIQKWTMFRSGPDEPPVYDFNGSRIHILLSENLPNPARDTVYDFNDSLIYILSNENLPNLLFIFIQNRGNVNVNAIGKQNGSPLQVAASKGYLSVAQQLIAAGADIEFSGGKFGPTPLFSALHSYNQDVAQLLLDNGARHDIVDGNSETPLIIAAKAGFITVAQKLLRLGANTNVDDCKALQAAAKWRHWEMVQLLLESGDNVNFECQSDRNGLQEATSPRNCPAVQLLLQSGAVPNSERVSHYSNALEAAGANGRVDMIQLLLRSGANVNRENIKHGITPQAAASGRREQIMRMLLHGGADLNCRGGFFAGNALLLATKDENGQEMQLLLHTMHNMNNEDGVYSGCTIDTATINENGKVMSLIINTMADMNSVGRRRGSALHVAARYGNEQVARMLLDSGADVNITRGSSGSALQEAAFHGHEQVVRLLLDTGADVNIIGGYSGSALQAAASHGNEQIVEMLLNAGADVNKIGEICDSALQAAVKHGYSDIAQLLRLHGAKEAEI